MFTQPVSARRTLLQHGARRLLLPLHRRVRGQGLRAQEGLLQTPPLPGYACTTRGQRLLFVPFARIFTHAFVLQWLTAARSRCRPTARRAALCSSRPASAVRTAPVSPTATTPSLAAAIEASPAHTATSVRQDFWQNLCSAIRVKHKRFKNSY